MTNWTAIEDTAYDLAEEGLDSTEIAFELMSEFGIDQPTAKDVAEEAIELVCSEEEPDWDREMGFDPYEGCTTWDC